MDKQAIVFGKQIEFNEETVFLVQTGKGGSSYKTRYCFNDLEKALFYYAGINVGRGYKKRIVMPAGEGGGAKVLDSVRT